MSQVDVSKEFATFLFERINSVLIRMPESEQKSEVEMYLKKLSEVMEITFALPVVAPTHAPSNVNTRRRINHEG